MFLPEGGRPGADPLPEPKIFASNRRRPGPWLNTGLPARIC